MASANSPYNQLGLGDCGHVVQTWPQIDRKGIALVFCDQCVRESFAIDDDEQFILVRLVKPKKATAIRSRKVKAPSGMEPLF